MTDEFYMRRCLVLAEKAEGYTYPNPLVGAVIVHNDRIIGEGYHHKAGEAHAEINAINSVDNKALLKESTIYVSLEPCAHFGRTPPCALALVQHQFKKVVIGCVDSNTLVHGKGIEILRDAGIEVKIGVLEKECRELNRRFFTFHQQGRPYIILKWAESADGFIDKNGQPTQISNTLSRQFVHDMRSREHAILVGRGTALADNPSLTTREIIGRNPIRIVLDRYLKVPTTHNLYNEDAQTLVLNTIREDDDNNISFQKIKAYDSLSDMLSLLHREGIQSVLVEGGRATLERFIEEDLWDEAYVISNPNLRLASGTQAPLFAKNPHNKFNLRDNTVTFYKNNQ